MRKSMTQENVKVNLNQKVKFHLTEEGKTYLKAFNESEIKTYGSSFKPASLNYDAKTGMVVMQLHEFMYTFGRGTFVGAPNYIVDNNIFISNES
jgi:hypothetical protein